jgi:hypothetical protein
VFGRLTSANYLLSINTKKLRRSGGLPICTHQNVRSMTLRPRLVTGLPFRYHQWVTIILTILQVKYKYFNPFSPNWGWLAKIGNECKIRPINKLKGLHNKKLVPIRNKPFPGELFLTFFRLEQERPSKHKIGLEVNINYQWITKRQREARKQGCILSAVEGRPHPCFRVFRQLS